MTTNAMLAGVFLAELVELLDRCDRHIPIARATLLPEGQRQIDRISAAAEELRDAIIDYQTVDPLDGPDIADAVADDIDF